MASHRASSPRREQNPRQGKSSPKVKQRWTAEDRRSRAASADVRDKVRVSKVSRGRKRDLADVRDAEPRQRASRDSRPNPREREERLARDLGERGYDASREGRGQRRPIRASRVGDESRQRDAVRRAEKKKFDDFGPSRPPRAKNRFDRDDRRFDRADSRGYDRREDRPRFDRDGGRYDRDDRPRFNRDDRHDDRPRYQRDDRRDDRPRFNRDDRDGRRDDRPRYNRDDRPRFDRDGRRDDRPRYNRDDRPRFDRDDRRDDRPRYNRDDRRDDRPGYNRDDRPRFEREDRPHDRSRFDRDDRRHDRPRFDDAPEKDEMEWTPAEAATGGSETGPFAALGVPAELVAALDAQGITEPFPIQAATIPDALAGRDVLGRGQTGSGKTVAFGIPLLTRLQDGDPAERRPRALILVPTRELALQVADALAPLAAAAGLSLNLITGGMSYEPQLRAFRRGVDVLVATPGRLIDHLESENVDLGAVQVAVLDEADLMADMGFTPAVRQILDATAEGGQRLLFSATLDDAVDHLVRQYLHDPIVHEVDPDAAAVATMTHQVFHVHGADKAAVAAQIAHRPGRTVVFVRTQKGADRVASEFLEQGVLAAALHGGLTQGARARVLAAFREGTIPVLVATDVAARGIHVDDVSLVLQLDPPADSKDYLHRAGRTARAGADGLVVTVVQPRQRKVVARLLEQAGVEVTPRRVRPGDDLIVELTGGEPVTGDAIDPEEAAKLTAPKKGPGKKRGSRYGAPRHGRGDRGPAERGGRKKRY